MPPLRATCGGRPTKKNLESDPKDAPETQRLPMTIVFNNKMCSWEAGTQRMARWTFLEHESVVTDGARGRKRTVMPP